MRHFVFHRLERSAVNEWRIIPPNIPLQFSRSKTKNNNRNSTYPYYLVQKDSENYYEFLPQNDIETTKKYNHDVLQENTEPSNWVLTFCKVGLQNIPQMFNQMDFNCRHQHPWTSGTN